MRAFARAKAGNDGFFEVYIKADVETCSKRDPKGLYQKAQAGTISQFTGISSPYEEPEQPELVLDTTLSSVQECVQILLQQLLIWIG